MKDRVDGRSNNPAIIAKIGGLLFIAVLIQYITNFALSANDWGDLVYQGNPEKLLHDMVVRNYLIGFAAAVYMALVGYIAWRISAALKMSERKIIVAVTLLVFLILLVLLFGPDVFSHEPLAVRQFTS